MESKSKRGGGPGYNTGSSLRQIYVHLVRDFRISEGSNFMAGVEYDLLTDIKTFRDRDERDLGLVSVGRFKRTKQIEALLKKFRFATDSFTDAELSVKSRQKFLESQLRLNTPMPLKSTGKAVLRRARRLASTLLGEFPGDEVINNMRFGKKSSIGCPLSLAYIDNKLSILRTFTGTGATSKFFLDQVLPGDHILQRILSRHNFDELKDQLNMTHLNLVEVPKTWKAYRLITPLTLLGLFYSYGVGRVVTDRLKTHGLDIGTLQERHRSLVKGYSATRSHATADLSEASDSITSELLNRVLPRPWYRALKKTFVRHLNVDGELISTASVLPMGNGATFPVETLVFYCLLKAIGELTGVKGTYSVYGDDLIYPSGLHRYVTAIFPQFHFRLNLDKTFVSYPFRESCGSDFYRGQDVRPYFAKGQEEVLTRVRYESWLYKVYNGLTFRWDPEEIRGTLTWILSELSMISRGICRVPPSFPDYSGVKVSSPIDKPLSYAHLPWKPVTIQFYSGSRWYQFDYLTETPKKRVVRTVEPYYWLALQGLDDDTLVEEFHRSETFTTRSGEIRYCGVKPGLTSVPRERPRSNLSWCKLGPSKTVSYYLKGRKHTKDVRRKHAVVASRIGATVSTATARTESISDWF